jgi:hypothetical protein
VLVVSIFDATVSRGQGEEEEGGAEAITLSTLCCT